MNTLLHCIDNENGSITGAQSHLEVSRWSQSALQSVFPPGKEAGSVSASHWPTAAFGEWIYGISSQRHVQSMRAPGARPKSALSKGPGTCSRKPLAFSEAMVVEGVWDPRRASAAQILNQNYSVRQSQNTEKQECNCKPWVYNSSVRLRISMLVCKHSTWVTERKYTW